MSRTQCGKRNRTWKRRTSARSRLSGRVRASLRSSPIVIRLSSARTSSSECSRRADVARTSKEKKTGEVVEAISEAPSGPRVMSPDDDDARTHRSREGDRHREVASEHTD